MLRPYEQCATRLENRGYHPPTREYVDNLVEGLLASGVEASWHSAVDPLGMPLFPSRVFPICHPQANMDAFRYLIDRLHEIGRPVVSWYPLNLGGGVLRALLSGLRPPRITLQGPLCVTMNARVQADGRWAVHLHNAPGSAYAYPAPPRSNYLHTSGEVVPARDLVIEVCEGSVKSAHSGISGETYRVLESSRVQVPLLALHDVVLLEVSDG